jgi:hypothetical protein
MEHTTRAGMVDPREVIRRAAAVYRRHSERLGCVPQAVEVGASVLRGPKVFLHDAAGRYLGLCRWSGSRVTFAPSCIDCRAPRPEWYMVHDKVWRREAGYRGDEQACLVCLEKRLGRKLGKKDFTTAPVNDAHRMRDPAGGL